MPRAAGFTLIELLVTLVLIGLATTTVLLTMPDDDQTLHRQADNFAAALARARDEAVLSGRTVEVGVDPDGYRFSRQDFEHWEPIAAPPLSPRSWDDGVRPALPHGHARIGFRFDPIGASEPQALVLAREAGEVRIEVDADGRVRIDGGAR